MLNNLIERPEVQDAGTIILTGFEPYIVPSSLQPAASQQLKESVVV